MERINDFDFIVGKWKVLNRRLKERLSGSDVWIEFEAGYKSNHILGGMGNMDEIQTKQFGDPFCGLSIRIFNDKNKEWTIYWSDNQYAVGKLKEQVVGKFENGIGTFYGNEFFNDVLVKLRFVWKSISQNEAYWEQAYFDEINDKWEVNWTMEFTRI